jgi:predicted alpha/beta hydrolase family esterase
VKSETPILIIPGYGDSGPGHWQSLWQARRPNARRVQQRDWNQPLREEWVAALDAEIAASAHPPVLVAHSLGCLTVAWWAQGQARSVAGALLVASPDLEEVLVDGVEDAFMPIPRARLPFPSILVASRDDPFGELPRAEQLARAWGARFVDAGDAGHLNADAGYGEWPAGEALLAELLT